MGPKKDRKKFTFENKKNETLIKLPGDIAGKDFVIWNCENCDIYIFDHSAQVIKFCPL